MRHIRYFEDPNYVGNWIRITFYTRMGDRFNRFEYRRYTDETYRNFHRELYKIQEYIEEYRRNNDD